MKKIFLLVSMLIISFTLLFTGCPPPEVTSAKVYMNENNYEMALEQAKTAVEKYPENATAHFILGKVYSELKEYDKMVDAFGKSLGISSEHSEEIKNIKELKWFQIFNVGIENYNNNNLEVAVKNFATAIKIKPDDINSYKNLALCYSNLDSSEKAINTLEKAITMNPESIDMRKSLGIAYYQAHEFEKSIEVFEKVAEETQSDTSQADTYQLAIQQIAFSYDQLGESEKAIEAYNQALKVFPDNPDLIYNLGRLYYMQENYEQAIINFKQVADINPDDYNANYNTGLSYLKAEENENAIPYFKKALDLKPESIDAWHNIGVAYVKANMPEKGKAAFDKEDELKAANQ